VRGDVPVDSEALVVTDFINLKIKSTQSFEGAHRGRVCVRMFIEMSTHTYINIYVYVVFLKKKRCPARFYFFGFVVVSFVFFLRALYLD
jgi:hypothetical protein